MPEILSIALLLVLAWGVWRTLTYRQRMKNSKRVIKKEESWLDFAKTMSKPRNALHQGRRDMFERILGITHKNPASLIDLLFWDESRDPVYMIANTMSEHEWMVEKYKNLDIKEGRTSRRYMSSDKPEEFEQYILGGRQFIDRYDKIMDKIAEEKRIEVSRQTALEDSDRFHNETRRAHRGLISQEEAHQSDLEKFDKEMKEIENGK